MQNSDLILLAMEPSATLDLFERALHSAGYKLVIANTAAALEKNLLETIPTILLIAERLGKNSGLDLAKVTLERFPTMPIIYYAARHDPALVLEVMRSGIKDYIFPPLKIDAIVRAVQRSLNQSHQIGDWVRREKRQSTAALEARVNEMDTLVKLSRSITSSLDLDSVLANVVTAAVELTGAEEGLLLLPDKTTNELYMRAGKNYDQNYARAFRLRVNDSLAGQVMQTGKSISFCQDSPNKIKTSYLVYSLIYVPLFANGVVNGVMGVDNQRSKKPFSQHHEMLMKLLADFAAIAIQNAQLYEKSEFERTKLESTVTNIQDGIILLDDEQRILVINPAAKNAFGLGFKDLTNMPVLEAIVNAKFVEILNSSMENPLIFHEIAFEDGRVFNMQYTPIHQIGAVIAIKDISHLRMVDRLKNDFINSISHDLRSPLTAIIGYVELLDRVGPLNEQQKDFIKNVQNSAHNITELVNDLLDLGRIEAGFDTRKDEIAMGTLLRYTLENLDRQVEDKELNLHINIAPDLPILRGNPLRIRQVMDNLLVNAIKYTPNGGKVDVKLTCESDQIIFEVADSGIGIPLADLNHVFEKFYRAENAPQGTPGTGLGLAIVKSIVENHSGQIWVDSTFGRGSTFTVVLPTNPQPKK